MASTDPQVEGRIRHLINGREQRLKQQRNRNKNRTGRQAVRCKWQRVACRRVTALVVSDAAVRPARKVRAVAGEAPGKELAGIGYEYSVRLQSPNSAKAGFRRGAALHPRSPSSNESVR